MGKFHEKYGPFFFHGKGNDSVWRLIIRLTGKILFSVPLSVIFGEIGSNKSVNLEQTTLLGAL